MLLPAGSVGAGTRQPGIAVLTTAFAGLLTIDQPPAQREGETNLGIYPRRCLAANPRPGNPNGRCPLHRPSGRVAALYTPGPGTGRERLRGRPGLRRLQ